MLYRSIPLALLVVTTACTATTEAPSAKQFEENTAHLIHACTAQAQDPDFWFDLNAPTNRSIGEWLDWGLNHVGDVLREHHVVDDSAIVGSVSKVRHPTFTEANLPGFTPDAGAYILYHLPTQRLLVAAKSVHGVLHIHLKPNVPSAHRLTWTPTGTPEGLIRGLTIPEKLNAAIAQSTLTCAQLTAVQWSWKGLLHDRWKEYAYLKHARNLHTSSAAQVRNAIWNHFRSHTTETITITPGEDPLFDGLASPRSRYKVVVSATGAQPMTGPSVPVEVSLSVDCYYSQQSETTLEPLGNHVTASSYDEYRGEARITIGRFTVPEDHLANLLPDPTP